MKRWGLVLIFGSVAAAGLALGRPSTPAAVRSPPLPVVEVVEVAARDVLVSVRAYGTVEPRTEIDLVIEVPGRIRAVSPNLATGGHFAAGELLVELDPADARLAVERAAAVLARTESEARLCDARLARFTELAKRQVTSPSKLEESESAQRTARAQVREARASLDQAHRDLDRTRVHAPFAGRVRDKKVDVGQFVASGTPAARIYASDAVEVRLPIPSAELRYLDLAVLGADGEGPPVRLRAQFAGQEVAWSGRVVRSEGEFAAQSRMLHLVARVDGQDGDPDRAVPLTVGLFVDAEIVGRRFERVFELPASALRGDGEVLVVNDGERLEARRVVVLRVEAERVLVSEGLAPGERVAVSTLAERGAPVRVVVVPGAAAARGGSEP